MSFSKTTRGSGGKLHMIVVVLPAFNEARNLVSLIPGIAGALRGTDFHIAVVDDGSTDNTQDVCMEYSEQLPVSIVRHEHNRGFGNALRAGLESGLKVPDGDASIIVTMDADNSHPPQSIPHLIEPILDGRADVSIASRFAAGARTIGVPRYRMCLSAGACMLLKGCFHLPNVRDYTSGFRGISAPHLRRALTFGGNGSPNEQGFTASFELLYRLSQVGSRFVEVPFTLRYDRKMGSSKMPVAGTVYRYMLLIWKYAIVHRVRIC